MTTIDRIETMILDIPTIRGHVLSMATMRSQSAVLVRIKFSDGSDGIGEGTTIGGLTYGAESPESIQSAIDTFIAPALIGRDGDDVNGAYQLMEKLVRGNRIAKAAVEIALWDGLGKRLGVPVSQLFGGAVHRKMPVAWTLASGNSDTDIAEALEMIEARRHNIFKLKIGKRAVRDDVAHVARSRVLWVSPPAFALTSIRPGRFRTPAGAQGAARGRLRTGRATSRGPLSHGDG